MIKVTLIYIMIIILIVMFKNNIITKLYIDKLKLYDVKFKKNKIPLHILVIALSIIIFNTLFVLLNLYLKNIVASLILSLYISLIPFWSYKYYEYLKKEKILKVFPNFIINLKSYVKVDNNIIKAFNNVLVTKPLKISIDKFNLLVKSGISISDAFSMLKKDISIKRINNFLTIVEFSHINGGDLEKVLDKFIKQEMEIINLKEKEKKESYTSKLMLISLILVNILVVFGIMFREYYSLYTDNLVGKIIIIMNCIIYIIEGYMFIKINKMEE